MANYVNEALVTINNRTKGKSIMPNSVFVDKAGINGNVFLFGEATLIKQVI